MQQKTLKKLNEQIGLLGQRGGASSKALEQKLQPKQNFPHFLST